MLKVKLIVSSTLPVKCAKRIAPPKNRSFLLCKHQHHLVIKKHLMHKTGISFLKLYKIIYCEPLFDSDLYKGIKVKESVHG